MKDSKRYEELKAYMILNNVTGEQIYDKLCIK